MDEPVLSYDVPMDGDTWVDAGGYALWTRSEPAGTVLQLWKRADGRAAPLDDGGYALHNVRAGLPHRLSHGFGFWRVSDGDTIFLKTTDGPVTHYTFAVTIGAPQYRADRIVWYCAGCDSEIGASSFETKRFGVPAFWAWTLGEVRRFNAEPANRTCPACAQVHLPAYGLMRQDDTSTESEARKSW